MLSLTLILATIMPAQLLPNGWICPQEYYDDGVCDCGCEAVDTDCAAQITFTGCDRSGCEVGTVPWEHQPEFCMGTRCGDGWTDEASGETCDDFNRTADGGCNEDCTQVNEGWTCGTLAEGCWGGEDAEPPVATPEEENGEDEHRALPLYNDFESEVSDPYWDPDTGCRSTNTSGWLFLWIAPLLVRRTKRLF